MVNRVRLVRPSESTLSHSQGLGTTLIDALRSGMAAPDFSIDGPNGLALTGRTLYIANGEGDTHRNGPGEEPDSSSRSNPTGLAAEERPVRDHDPRLQTERDGNVVW